MSIVSMTDISNAIRTAACEIRGPHGRLRYVTDGARHLICIPYKAEYLHVMADELGIKRCWFHSGKYPHYDIPKRRIARSKPSASASQVKSCFASSKRHNEQLACLLLGLPDVQSSNRLTRYQGAIMAHTFSSSLFGFSSNLQLLATEVSRLERAARTNGASIWQRIFPEVSDDQGFVVRSEQTGIEAVWFVNDVDVREGEIQGWRLKPTLETIARIPSLKGVRMLVVNT